MFLRKWSKDRTENIIYLKRSLQNQIRSQNNYLEKIKELENKKRFILREYIGFENRTVLTDKKDIEQTEDFQNWKEEVNEEYQQKINTLKEDLEEQYLSQKQELISDYQIFMSIAEDIGYDAVGKPTSNNELDVIETELQRFITHIENTEKP